MRSLKEGQIRFMVVSDKADNLSSSQMSIDIIGGIDAKMHRVNNARAKRDAAGYSSRSVRLNGQRYVAGDLSLCSFS